MQDGSLVFKGLGALWVYLEPPILVTSMEIITFIRWDPYCTGWRTHPAPRPILTNQKWAFGGVAHNFLGPIGCRISANPGWYNVQEIEQQQSICFRPMGRLYKQLLLGEGHVSTSIWRPHPQATWRREARYDHVLPVGPSHVARSVILLLLPHYLLEVSQWKVSYIEVVCAVTLYHRHKNKYDENKYYPLWWYVLRG